MPGGMATSEITPAIPARRGNIPLPPALTVEQEGPMSQRVMLVGCLVGGISFAVATIAFAAPGGVEVLALALTSGVLGALAIFDLDA